MKMKYMTTNNKNTEIQPHNNKPLIIEAEEGIGKKTLVVKWMEYHQANSKKVGGLTEHHGNQKFFSIVRKRSYNTKFCGNRRQ